MSTVAEGKGNTCGKNEKNTAKSAEEQDNELTDGYQNYDLIWYLHKEKETSLRLPRKLPQGTRLGLRL